MEPKISTKRIAVCAMIAAMYNVLILAVAMFMPALNYGMFQVRIAESLTILPVITPVAIWGVGLGCFIANLIGWLTGANPIGAIDTIVGTAASIIAGIITYRLRNFRIRGWPIASALSPVIVNAIIIGLQLNIVFHGSFIPGAFITYALWVGLGQLIACVGLGLPLWRALERTNILADV